MPVCLGDNSVSIAPEIIGGTKKKSYSRSGPGGQRKRSRKASDTTLAVVAAGTTAIRIENGEIRPLRGKTSVHEDCDIEGDIEENDNPNGSNIDERSAVPGGVSGINGHNNGGPAVSGGSSHRRSDRRKRSDNHDKVMAPPSNGGTGIPPGMVGGLSIKATVEKDELNHIIPESKKFPQVSHH